MRTSLALILAATCAALPTAVYKLTPAPAAQPAPVETLLPVYRDPGDPGPVPFFCPPAPAPACPLAEAITKPIALSKPTPLPRPKPKPVRHAQPSSPAPVTPLENNAP